jgi:hypothetical protein
VIVELTRELACLRERRSELDGRISGIECPAFQRE